ncbi:MAG: ATP-dependent Clp protease ATP-binding subunit [Patescibacteria group bacterium]|nr:ATP-dependent Clp protease ATP-binding subunit [Patescibacteria group bacterium]
MRTILGYHDKKSGEYKIINKQLPLIIGEDYDPFALSTKQFFYAQTTATKTRLKAVPIRRAIKKTKNLVAYILIIPGILTSIIYIMDFLTAVSMSNPLPVQVPEKVTNFTFWIAIWGAMILWHGSYKSSDTKENIDEGKSFSEHDKKLIDEGDLGLSKRSYVNCLDILSSSALKYISKSTHSDEINSYQLLQNLLKNTHVLTILKKLDLENFPKDLEKNNISEETLPTYPTSIVRSLLVYSAEEAVLTNSHLINPEHLFITMFKLFPVLNKYIRTKKQNIEIMQQVVKWLRLRQKQVTATKIFDPDVPYFRTGGIANAWLYGYTFILGHYSTDLTQKTAQKGGHYGIGHADEMTETISILSKVSKNNVLLIGESGTGKTSVVKGLAERINRGEVPRIMQNMRIIQLDINGLLAAAPQHGNLEALVKKSMEELQKAGNTILFIDEIQEIVPAQGKGSQHSLSGILLPYVLDSKFPIIGTITYADYKRYFSKLESLKQSFQRVEIKEVSPNAAFEIILTRLKELEGTYNIKITFPAILACIELAQRYVYDRKLPDSAVNIIESACASLEKEGHKKLTPELVAKTVSTQTNIPVEQVSTNEATKLLKLEEKIKQKVIGQDEAVHKVVEALKRARTSIRDITKPIGTFLFLGPTGVGKTYLTKTICKEYFGAKHKIVRLDMSEFKQIQSIERLLGSSDISETSPSTNTFLDKIKRDPFTVVLLDEIEKAHPQILDLFLQLLDEGRLTSNTGETINFSNTIIIATSNIGSKYLLETLEKDTSLFEEAKTQVLKELRQNMRVEFINRFDKIIVFSPHPIDNLTKITELLLKELKVRLLEKEITLEWNKGVPRKIAQKAQEPGMGARPLRRYIQDNIESIIATKLLHDKIKSGDSFTITNEHFD